MRAMLGLFNRRSVPGLLAIAIGWALLGCCCPTLPLMLTRADAAATATAEAAPTALIAGPAAVR